MQISESFSDEYTHLAVQEDIGSFKKKKGKLLGKMSPSKEV
jgi:hypothetical protein